MVLELVLHLTDARLLVLLGAKQLLNLSEAAIDAQVFSRELLDNLIFVADIVVQAPILIFNSSFVFKEFCKSVLNIFLL